MKKTLVSIAAALLLSGCNTTFETSNQLNQPSASQLLSWMQGSFNSSIQANADKSYYNIHLNMVEIWPEDPNGPWLYVEQAADGFLEKPYRQRVYRLKALADGQFESEVYSFDNPLNFAGHWQNPNPLAALKPSDLSIRVGCSVFLNWQPDSQSYSGSTDAKKCQSSLRGASYATSIVTVFSDRIESWDQGFDDKDKQVWGATKAGYVFDRQ